MLYLIFVHSFINLTQPSSKTTFDLQLLLTQAHLFFAILINMLLICSQLLLPLCHFSIQNSLFSAQLLHDHTHAQHCYQQPPKTTTHSTSFVSLHHCWQEVTCIFYVAYSFVSPLTFSIIYHSFFQPPTILSSAYASLLYNQTFLRSFSW